ncbi:hypothetical protein DPEC_G00147900 [Dallia pectoralis]|uniref:Uncharacterized protein n=1 Tax=Dallia pectoralis TaxID=75939 RepID=A0ACC2GIK4_DALPE|nr:hypothetical protein DPEC_G00147900 [Dallia pectoralis]
MTEKMKNKTLSKGPGASVWEGMRATRASGSALQSGLFIVNPGKPNNQIEQSATEHTAAPGTPVALHGVSPSPPAGNKGTPHALDSVWNTPRTESPTVLLLGSGDPLDPGANEEGGLGWRVEDRRLKTGVILKQ